MSQPPPTQAEIERAIAIIREDKLLAGNSALVERLDRLEQRIQRMPVTEMTAEEKAAAYDKLMAEQNKPPKEPPKNDPPKPPGGPVPPDPKPPADPKPPKKDPFWGDRLNNE